MCVYMRETGRVCGANRSLSEGNWLSGCRLVVPQVSMYIELVLKMGSSVQAQVAAEALKSR